MSKIMNSVDLTDTVRNVKDLTSSAKIYELER